MNSTKKIMLIILTVLTASIMTGCGKQFTVDHYPDFYKPSIKSVAVLPFENESSRKKAGMAVASHLSAALAANGTYKVTGPVKLEQTLKEKGMPSIKNEDYKAIANELAELDMYQAFITGRVLTESFRNTVIEYYDDDDDFYYDDYPYWYYPYGYPPYWYYPYYYEYGGQAYVSSDVSFVSIPDGTVLDTVAAKASAGVNEKFSSLKKYTTQIALNKFSEKVVRDFAIVPVKITVPVHKAIRTADSLQQGNWHFTKTFNSSGESMYVVLCLPAAAAMNQFEITITPQNNPSDIISSKDYTWEKDKYCQSVEFSPGQIARSNGPGKYSVHLISLGKIVLTRNFKIK